jgi:hypothetical protein
VLTEPTLTTPQALLELVREFDALGIHRTGSPGDNATTAWLARHLAAMGVTAKAWSFAVPRLETRAAYVDTLGRQIAGHAQMDAGLTPTGGVEGPLVPVEAVRRGAIAVLDIDVSASTGHDIEQAVQRGAAAAAAGLVVIARRGGASAFLVNAPRVWTPDPLPVLFVPPADADPIRQAVAEAARARLVVDGVRRLVTAENVVGHLPADAPRAGMAPLGVMTPKSGWFWCAAERGGGIAVWLAVAQTLAAMRGRGRDVVLLATSGHELGHSGLEAYLLAHPNLAAGAVVWLHLGASIGAAVAPPLGLFASDAPLLEQARAALDAAGAGPYRVQPAGLVPGGEARNIAVRGGRYISLAGGHAFFHTPEDRPDAVDAHALARFASACTALARTLMAG